MDDGRTGGPFRIFHTQRAQLSPSVNAASTALYNARLPFFTFFSLTALPILSFFFFFFFFFYSWIQSRYRCRVCVWVCVCLKEVDILIHLNKKVLKMFFFFFFMQFYQIFRAFSSTIRPPGNDSLVRVFVFGATSSSRPIFSTKSGQLIKNKKRKSFSFFLKRGLLRRSIHRILFHLFPLELKVSHRLFSY